METIINNEKMVPWDHTKNRVCRAAGINPERLTELESIVESVKRDSETVRYSQIIEFIEAMDITVREKLVLVWGLK